MSEHLAESVALTIEDAKEHGLSRVAVSVGLLDATLEKLTEHASLTEKVERLEMENVQLGYLAYGPRHDVDCPALWGAGFCKCGLRDRIDEWKQKRAELDVLLESE